MAALCCAAQASLEARNEKLESLCRDVNWCNFTRAALEQRVLLLLYRNLRELGRGAVPVDILAAFESFHDENRHHIVALIEEVIKINDLLKAHKVRAIFYKGPMLAIAAYGDIGFRQVSSDIDILVHPRDFARAKNLFISHGFQEWMSLVWKSHLHRPDDRLEIDLHHAFVPGWYGVSLDFDELWDRCQSFVVSESALACLCPEDLIMALCIDLVKDTAQGNFVPFIKLCDLAHLLKAERRMDWNESLKQARKWGVHGSVSMGTHVVSSLFDVPTPGTLSKNLSSHFEVRAIAASDINHVLISSLPNLTISLLKSSKFLRRHLQEALVIASLADGVSAKIITVLRRCLYPTPYDIDCISLPQNLYFLYYFVRPFRIMMKYFSFGRRGSVNKPVG